MDSPCESESSLDSGTTNMLPPSPVSREHLQKRIESLTQQNRYDNFICWHTYGSLLSIFIFLFSIRVLKVELETYKIRVKVLQEENRTLRQASVTIVRILRSSFMD